MLLLAIACFIQDGKQITVSNPLKSSSSNVQMTRQIHENAIEETTALFEQHNLKVTTNVSIKSSNAAQRSVIDQLKKQRILVK